jgi:hypothetical protein
MSVKPDAVSKVNISDPIALSLSKGDRIIQNLSRFDASSAPRAGKLSANGVFLDNPRLSDISREEDFFIFARIPRGPLRGIKQLYL